MSGCFKSAIVSRNVQDDLAMALKSGSARCLLPCHFNTRTASVTCMTSVILPVS